MTRMSDDLDATGLLCPLPVLKTRKRLMALSSGDELRILTDDPAAIVDMPHFCAEGRHELIGMTTSGSETAAAEHVFLIRKGQP